MLESVCNAAGETSKVVSFRVNQHGAVGDGDRLHLYVGMGTPKKVWQIHWMSQNATVVLIDALDNGWGGNVPVLLCLQPTRYNLARGGDRPNPLMNNFRGSMKGFIKIGASVLSYSLLFAYLVYCVWGLLQTLQERRLPSLLPKSSTPWTALHLIFTSHMGYTVRWTASVAKVWSTAFEYEYKPEIRHNLVQVKPFWPVMAAFWEEVNCYSFVAVRQYWILYVPLRASRKTSTYLRL